MEKTRQVYTLEVNANGHKGRQDALVSEEPLEIRIGFGAGQSRRRFPVAVTMRTPGDDEELAIGFLFTEGVIMRSESVLGTRILDENVLLVDLNPDIYVDENRLMRHFFTSSSCGVCGKATLDSVRILTSYYPVKGQPVLSSDLIFSLPERMMAAQETFTQTGGLHACGLFDSSGNLLVLREDVGRHNAVDKVIGAMMRQGRHFPLRDCVMCVSGRAGFEIVQKASMVGLPVLCAVGAPSSLAVELAEAGDMSLVGFLRNQRFNIYNGEERIKMP